MLQSIDFDRFMTSEGTYHREDIFKHFIGLIIDIKGSRVRTIQRGFFCAFFIDFYLR